MTTSTEDRGAIQDGGPTVDARTVDMAGRWADGETLESIGHSYGVTRERVRQIMKSAGLTTAEEARLARRAAREADDARIRDALLAWAANNPGRTRAEAAVALGIKEDQISLLGAEAHRLFVSERVVAERYTDADVSAAIRAAAALHGQPLAADQYDEYQQQHGGPSSVRIIQRLGTWNAACAAAGLAVNKGRRVYRRRWTEAQMLEHVADYLETEGSRGSYAGYDAYARATPGAPSSQTVRNAFRDWANAKAAAHQLVAARARRRLTS